MKPTTVGGARKTTTGNGTVVVALDGRLRVKESRRKREREQRLIDVEVPSPTTATRLLVRRVTSSKMKTPFSDGDGNGGECIHSLF
ncbi:hypothetical protein Hanom_Chr17g01559671 [Helianthus anomalus]